MRGKLIRQKRATNWSGFTSWDEVCRRAAGRRHYNSWRQFMAQVRRRKVAELAWKYGLVDWGAASRMAAVLGVHRSTVTRDIKAILAELNEPRPCPCCGTVANWIER